MQLGSLKVFEKCSNFVLSSLLRTVPCVCIQVGVTERLCYRVSDCPAPWNLRPVATLSAQLVKPWGVCCAGDSAAAGGHLLLVADRDAHAVLAFDRHGAVVARRTSNFRRPTHLAVTSRGHVVVTDKDNHRVQILAASSWHRCDRPLVQSSRCELHLSAFDGRAPSRPAAWGR